MADAYLACGADGVEWNPPQKKWQDGRNQLRSSFSGNIGSLLIAAGQTSGTVHHYVVRRLTSEHTNPDTV